eukprot:6212903-Pleurochrysis_carterae.AAC.1
MGEKSAGLGTLEERNKGWQEIKDGKERNNRKDLNNASRDQRVTMYAANECQKMKVAGQAKSVET